MTRHEGLSASDQLRDRPLDLSMLLHGQPDAGRVPPVLALIAGPHLLVEGVAQGDLDGLQRSPERGRHLNVSGVEADRRGNVVPSRSVSAREQTAGPAGRTSPEMRTQPLATNSSRTMLSGSPELQ